MFTREVAFAISVVNDRVTPKPVRNTGPWGYCAVTTVGGATHPRPRTCIPAASGRP